MNHCLRSIVLAILFFAVGTLTAQPGANYGTGPGNALPDGYATYRVTQRDDPAPGNYFVAPFGAWGMFTDITPHIAIVDNYGEVLYFKKIHHSFINDFTIQPDGQLSYAGGNAAAHYMMNDRMEVTDSIRPNGFWVDFHELLLRPDGTKFLLGIDARIIDMSQVVPGGQEDATVVGHVIQELDAENNVVFQWDTWDHFEITDVSDWVDLTAGTIDMAHVNTIEIDSDTSMLILSRNMNEITKIDRRTGDIIWRMGGKHNEFTFVNDTMQWGGPHDIRKIGDGMFTLFDNGRFNTPAPHYSSGVIYQIDEQAKTITQVKRFFNDPPVYGGIMGDVQLLDNGNYVIGWGSGNNPDSIGITEFKPDGSVALVMRFNGINYRAHKFRWQPRLFYPDHDTLRFGELPEMVDTTMTLQLHNAAGHDVVLTGYDMRYGLFGCSDQFPVILPANGSVALHITFQSDSEGVFEDAITIRSDNPDSTERICRQVYLKAKPTYGFGIKDFAQTLFRINPNPAHNQLHVQFEDAVKGTFQLLSTSGQCLITKEIDQQQAATLDVRSCKPGMYFLVFMQKNAPAVCRKIMIH